MEQKVSSNLVMRAAAGFTALVLSGAGLLMLPAALSPGRELSWMDALFTATSAATVTGLCVQDTASHFSRVGQLIIAVLMQVGAVGAMVIACRLLLGPSRGLVWRIVGVVVIVECIGAALLMPMYGFGGGLFHAISAFCNAGFDLTGHSLSGELYTMSTHVVMTGLIVLGGLGFPVLACRKALPGHARVVLVTTAGLYLTGVVVLIAGELMPYVSHQLNLNVTANRVEPEKLRARKFGAMVADASFMSVSARSAGFYTTPMDEISPAGRVMVMGLMMVGGSPGSAAGGMHTTTLALLLWAMWGTGGAGKGWVHKEAMAGAAMMAVFFVGLVLIASLLLSLTEPFPFSRLLFESISASTLSGLTQGITAELTTFGRCVIIACMWLGRVWPWILIGRLAVRGTDDPNVVLIG